MEFLHLNATYGRLEQQELHLRPGLNVICAPNEAGKSTWSSFIRTMLYGLPSRDRGPLADKNRYAPWSGAAMQGRMDVLADGRACTLLRSTRRAVAPMGDFSCTYTGTATHVEGITALNAGEQLLGVPRDVFESSAFIGQNALAVEQSAELERFVRDQLYIARTEQVMTDDLWQITELTVPEDVTVYSDLRWFTELKSLTLQNRTELSDDFLPALKKLETLDLSGCLVSAELMEQIGGLTALQTLNLNECGLSNISALGNLTELT